MSYDKYGMLTVKTFTAGGALPVVGSVVRIIGTDEENRLVEYSILTNVDGITEQILLPAPSAELSMAPGAQEQAYAKYNIEVIADGYYIKRIFDVAVFADNSSFQPIEMIPLPINKNNRDYPHGNLSAVVEENLYLE